MAIGERIHFFRLLRGMTQKYLGTAVGFPERSADVRLAQYETGSRKPKADLTAALAQALDVSPQALDVPDIDSQIGLMHTLFTLEDVYGLTVSETAGEVCLKVNKDKGTIRTRAKRLTSCCKCSMLGKSRRTSSLPVKSARMIMTAGVTTIRNTIPHKSGRKFLRRN